MKLIKRHNWIFLYLVAISFFAIIYAQIPNQFRCECNLQLTDWLYFSVVTITTLGYGEITPTTDIAKFLVSFEVLCGLFLLGMFLNGEAQNAIERKDKKYAKNALNHSFRMLSFMEQYFDVALGNNSHLTREYKEKFEDVAKKLKYTPEKFKFNPHVLDNIYWSSRHAVNDLRLVAIDSKALADDAFVHLSAIITSLELLEEAPLGQEREQDANKAPETMQHKASIAFQNAAILCEIVNNLKT
jgi:hypothetical protein